MWTHHLSCTAAAVSQYLADQSHSPRRGSDTGACACCNLTWMACDTVPTRVLQHLDFAKTHGRTSVTFQQCSSWPSRLELYKLQHAGVTYVYIDCGSAMYDQVGHRAVVPYAASMLAWCLPESLRSLRGQTVDEQCGTTHHLFMCRAGQLGATVMVNGFGDLEGTAPGSDKPVCQTVTQRAYKFSDTVSFALAVFPMVSWPAISSAVDD